MAVKLYRCSVVWAKVGRHPCWMVQSALDDAGVEQDDFFEAALQADRWRGRLYAVPWFVDVGMLYWRTDLTARAPRTFDELVTAARGARSEARIEYGFAWQGARYEGLVTVFLEHLTGFGGAILTDDGRVVVDSPDAIRALTFMLHDKPGFWESFGYHNYGDPWREQRYSGDE